MDKKKSIRERLRNLCSTASPEALRKMNSRAEQQLDRLIKVSSALLGLGFIFTNFVAVEWLRVMIILFFFLSLVLSFLGVLPFRVRYDIEEASDAKEQEISSFLRKRRYLWSSAGFMAAGFAVAIADLVVDLLHNLN